MKSLATVALTACLLAACGRTESLALPPTATPVSPPEESAYDPGLPTPAGLPRGARIIIQSASLSLAVDDPAKALSQIEGAVLELGGYIASSSSWSSPGSPASSSLSARVPPESLPALRRVATGLASQIQSDGTYSQDATADYWRLQERRQVLVLAEARLARLLTRADDQQLAESLLVAYQMLTQERVNVQAQLADYEYRATLATFDVTLNGQAAVLFVD